MVAENELLLYCYIAAVYMYAARIIYSCVVYCCEHSSTRVQQYLICIILLKREKTSPVRCQSVVVGVRPVYRSAVSGTDAAQEIRYILSYIGLYLFCLLLRISISSSSVVNSLCWGFDVIQAYDT